jgi:hypothetical protein
VAGNKIAALSTRRTTIAWRYPQAADRASERSPAAAIVDHMPERSYCFRPSNPRTRLLRLLIVFVAAASLASCTDSSDDVSNSAADPYVDANGAPIPDRGSAGGEGYRASMSLTWVEEMQTWIIDGDAGFRAPF